MCKMYLYSIIYMIYNICLYNTCIYIVYYNNIGGSSGRDSDTVENDIVHLANHFMALIITNPAGNFN